MKFLFEYIQEITPEPLGPTQFAHEPNNELWNYMMMSTLRLDNFVGQPNSGDYSTLTLNKKPTLITAKQIQNFGIKNSLGYGAYGFFTPAYQDSSYVLCPIHNRRLTGKEPVVTITALGDNVFRFNISSTEEYDCYRIELIKDFFTEEYIVYAIDGTAEYEVAPELAGELLVAVTGYSDEISVASEPFESSLTSTGTAPFVPTSAASSFTVTLTAEGWVNDEQIVVAPGVTPDNIVFVAPAPAYQSAYTFAGIVCMSQGENSLIFTCSTTPSAAIDVEVVII